VKAACGRASFSLQRVIGAFVFIVATVVLGKASQYDAVARFGPAIGFDAASLLRATPVVIVAAALQRRWRNGRAVAVADYPTR